MKEKSKEKNYYVFENQDYYGDGNKYYVYLADSFERIPVCETYGDYGQKVDSNMCHEEDENGEIVGECYEILANTWWNGQNWETTVHPKEDGFTDGKLIEVSDEIAEKIISELPEYPYIDGITETIETENYCFRYTRYPSDYICTVE